MNIIRLALVTLCFSLVGCVLNTSAIAPPANPQFEVRPNAVCHGEHVRARWDLTVAEKHDYNCSHPNGGYESRISCTDRSDCPLPGWCFENVCHHTSVDAREVDTGSGCMPDSVFSIISEPPLVGRPNPLVNEVPYNTGEDTYRILQSTGFTGRYVQVGPIYKKDLVQEVRVITENSNMPVPYTLRFEHQGELCTLTSASFDALDVFPSDKIHIVNITNTSGHRIALSHINPDVEPILLEAGEETNAFNGPVKGVWTATPVPAVRLPPAGCGSLATRPDPLEITVYVLCIE